MNRPVQLDRAAQGILSILGVSSRDYPAKDDFLSPKFAAVPRYLMEGRILYREDAAIPEP